MDKAGMTPWQFKYRPQCSDRWYAWKEYRGEHIVLERMTRWGILFATRRSDRAIRRGAARAERLRKVVDKMNGHDNG